MTDAELQFRNRCTVVGENFKIEKGVFVLNEGRIQIGDSVTFSGFSDIQFSNHANPQPELRIGDDTYIGHGCAFNIGQAVTIGKHCNLATGVRLRDNDGHPMDAMARRTQPTPPEGIGAIQIGDDVWIGTGAMVLKGVTIGDRSVVAAMAVVAGDVPPDTLVAGNPARAVRSLNGARPKPPAAPPDESVAGRLQWIVAQQAGIPSDDVDLARWADEYGIDSLQLLLLRELVESEFGVSFSDRMWVSFASLREVVEFCEARGGRARKPHAVVEAVEAVDERLAELQGGVLYAPVEIGIPLTGRNHLAEGPLLQLLGDLRWNQIRRFSGVPANRILDEEGARIYPSFFYVDLAFPEDRPMAAFELDDCFEAACYLGRFGTSVLDGVSYLLPPGTRDAAACAGAPRVRLSNVFVAQHNGAEWLRKSRPADAGFERIPTLPGEPTSIGLAKAAARDGCFSSPPSDYVRMAPQAIRVRHALTPDRDLNGAGLVYFAHYPVFLDIAEREALRTAELALAEELIDLRTVVRRQSAYLNNASARDTLLIEVEPWIRDPLRVRGLAAEDVPLRLWLNFRMYRESDQRLMMVSTVEKRIYQKTARDAPFLLERAR